MAKGVILSEGSARAVQDMYDAHRERNTRRGRSDRRRSPSAQPPELRFIEVTNATPDADGYYEATLLDYTTATNTFSTLVGCRVIPANSDVDLAEDKKYLAYRAGDVDFSGTEYPTFVVVSAIEELNTVPVFSGGRIQLAGLQSLTDGVSDDLEWGIIDFDEPRSGLDADEFFQDATIPSPVTTVYIAESGRYRIHWTVTFNLSLSEDAGDQKVQVVQVAAGFLGGSGEQATYSTEEDYSAQTRSVTFSGSDIVTLTAGSHTIGSVTVTSKEVISVPAPTFQVDSAIFSIEEISENRIIAPQEGVDDFLDLIDTPSSYTSQSGKIPAVNSGGTGLEFVSLREQSFALSWMGF